MATLRKINGSYYAYFYNRHRSPKRKSYPLGVSLKSAATKKLKRLEDEWAEGRFDPWNPGASQVTALTVPEAIDNFLEAKSHLRERTRSTYQQQLELWASDLAPDLLLQYVQSSHLEAFVWQSSISASTRCKRYRHLRVFINWARDNGYLDHNPLDELRQPKAEKKQPAFLKTTDLQELVEKIRSHGSTVTDAVGRSPDVQWLIDTIYLAVCTGLRRGELVNLHWSDIDLENGFLTVRNREGFQSKSGHERTVPLAGDAVKALNRLKERHADGNSDRVIVDRDGKPVKPNRITKRFKTFVEKADLDERLRFHSLRHTCASWLSMKGVPLRVIQSIMGHSEISVTERYSHLQPEVMSRAMRETFGDT